MSDRPILFSAPMVRALLDGRKTQTRRVLCTHSDDHESPYVAAYETGALAVWCDPIDSSVRRFPGAAGAAVGDRLWVREAWADVNTDGGPAWAYRANGAVRQPEYDGPDYGAGPSFDYEKYPGSYSMWVSDLFAGEPDHSWRSPIHMPRWASRLTLTVTDVRVQRVQEISEADARAEGVQEEKTVPGVPERDPRAQFADLWNDLNAARGHGWDANPWVVALTFTVARRNIDQAEAA